MGSSYVEEKIRFCCIQSSLQFFVLIPVAILLGLIVVEGNTDQNDLIALQVLYNSFNSPPQLTGWKTIGGDPCAESWTGVTCQGSAVVSIQISGFGVNGTMGYMLNGFMSLKTLDLSGNIIHDSIPYQLPPNLTSLNLSNNNISGGLPYSISGMTSLNYLNVSHNSLSQSIGDVFNNRSNMAVLDLSSNNFTGDLPPSFSLLSNLTTLYLQNNHLSGSLNLLVGLPLTDLNVAKNNFSGWIPRELFSIPNFKYDGNSFANGPAPPPPPYTPPPPGRFRNHSSPAPHAPRGSDSQPINPNTGNGDKGLKAGPIVGIVLGSSVVAFVALVALVFCLRKGKKKEIAARPSSGSLSASTGRDPVIALYYEF